MEPQTIIARRIARELSPGMLVNLGIGIPTLVANYLPEGMHVFFQSENGLIGTGAPPEEGMAHPTLTDAGGRPVTALPGASTFDSAMSFGLIRGGHLDLTVLGGLQVDQAGRLANWMIPEQDGAGHGRRHGSGVRRQARHRGDAAHRQGRSEDREEMHAAHHVDASGGPGRHRAGGDRIPATAARPCSRPAPEYPSPRWPRRPRPSSSFPNDVPEMALCQTCTTQDLRDQEELPHDSRRESQAARRQEEVSSSALPTTSRSPGAAPRRFARSAPSWR